MLSSKNCALRLSRKSKKRVCKFRICFHRETNFDFKENKMQQIIDTCPPEPEALIAKLQKTYIDRDTNKDRGSIVKGKGRERTIQGALANSKL